MTDALSFVLRRWPLFAALASASALAFAHLTEQFGLQPCHLCLQQREVYWVALLIAAVGMGLQVSRPVIGRWPAKAAIVLLGATFLFGAGLAAYHAGVEWRWWAGPASCTGGGGAVSMQDLTASLTGGVRAPMCDVAPGYVLGLSMAGWNALLSLGLALMSAAALRKREEALPSETVLV